ncbi:MAG TPA: M23 family metallopeptidase [Paraburkholderia sp.]|nr:M23 family metallopeptidase [Paraburkholderia sp.]
MERDFLSAVRRVGVSAAVGAMLEDAFAQQVDFRRDLRRGDEVKLVFERPANDTQKAADAGPTADAALPVAVRLAVGPRTHEVFLFRDVAGRVSYRAKQVAAQVQAQVQQKAHAVRAVLRYPLEFMRVSSRFAPMRVNPVTGERRAHDGVDLAAPSGTPVRATADGIVAFAGTQTGYGNVVKLRNERSYSTTFAHLSRVASGLRAGGNVREGDVIGYVGSTGWATGPHLHYEVRVDGVPRDPLSIELPRKEPLSATDASPTA